MKAQGTVKGILFEASDGAEYLLGFSAAQPAPDADPQPPAGRWHLQRDRGPPGSVEGGPREQLGISEGHLIGPGMGRSLFLWTAFKEALKTFPPVPTWPTWSP